MHERALIRDVVQRVLAVAETERGSRVTRVDVRLGALSHFTPVHFREHFEDAARGTLAEGAELAAVQDADAGAEHAAGVIVESVEVELPEEGGA